MADVDRSILKNLQAAEKAMRLTPEERDLYMRHLHNLWSDAGVDQPDGSRSSIRQMNLEVGGKFYNVPTVWNGKALDWDKPDERAQIVANVQKEGGWEAFPSYAARDEAETRYEQMHAHMEKDTGDWDAVRRGPLDLAPGAGLINSVTPDG